MSTNATQQIEGTRLGVAATVAPGSAAPAGRAVVSAALSTPLTNEERTAARVQLASNERPAPTPSRLGPGGDRHNRDFSIGVSIGTPGYYGPGYVVPGPVVVGPPVVVAPPVVVTPGYGPYYQPVVPYPPAYHRCGWLESLFDWNSFGRGRQNWCR